MIDIDEYESVVYRVTAFLEDNEQYGDDWSKEKKGLNDLFAEVKRLRKKITLAHDWVCTKFNDNGIDEFEKHMGDEEE